MKILVKTKKGNYSSGVEALCAFCESPFFKRGQNNRYCSKSCRQNQYVLDGRSSKYSRKYLENNQERRLVTSARSRAKKKGIDFTITHEDITLPKTCPILGIPLIISEGHGGAKNSPSLDRIDNSKGYVQGNIHVISHLANSMKSFSNKDELIKFAEWVLSHKDIL